MNKLENSKEIYDNIPIPDRLNDIVLAAIQQSDAKRASSNPVFPYELKREVSTDKTLRKKIKMFTAFGLATAAIFVAFTISININPALARELQDLPIIGRLVKLLTIYSYEENTEDLGISIEIPGIEFLTEDFNGLSDKINNEIRNMCYAYAEDAKKRAEEYREAFLLTGGTEEEWKEHDIRIKVWYEMKSLNDQYLSFVVMGTENWTSAFQESKYYNLDLLQMRYVTLYDLLGNNYIQIANQSIQQQINERKSDSNVTYWSSEEGGFQTITDTTKFYINENLNPVIVFDKYEIAPGAMGQIEFEIPVKKE